MIEKKIAQYVERQFPAFYKDEGPQFIAFVKAYYEWLERPENITYKSRHLLEYRDIDTTPDEFILYFKEKYLKNIQFDTATNKQALVKHSLDLYRSKGTERSIDLFFKLVFGTAAQVEYPGERVFKLSDGIWETPRYLEITYNRNNINYVGRQVIGSASGATAFVEKYIRRRAGYGYVNLLYISNQVGTFQRGEIIGIQSSGQAQYTANSAQLVGSIVSAILQDNGRDFQIGDIVTFEYSPRGIGGQARVTEVGEATGLIDFILHDGGYGYSVDATALISEKVLVANNIVGAAGGDTITLFDTVIQPMVEIEFSDGPTFIVGDQVRRYDGSNVVANGTVIDINQNPGSNSGTIIVALTTGPFTSGTYQINANVATMNGHTIQDYSAHAEIMGVPTQWQIGITNATASFAVGDDVYQRLSGVLYATGEIGGISGNNLTIINARGDWANGASIRALANNSVNAEVVEVHSTVGVYNINKRLRTLTISDANTPNAFLTSPYVYQYDAVANAVSGGLSVHSSVSSNTATIQIIPLFGEFQELANVYTVGNTSVGMMQSLSSNVYGGDFVETIYGRWITQQSNASFAVSSISEGTGAQFDVGTLQDTEVVQINTDIINSNNVPRIDYGRVQLNIGSNTGWSIGDIAVQTTNTTFDVYGTVYAVGSGFIRVKDTYNTFGPSGGANTNVLKYGTSTNTSISTTSVATAVSLPESNYRYLLLRAGTYGFPKNPQGDLTSIIYDCLDFRTKTIGTIASLSGIDPGSGYNVDPYVLVDEGSISAFGRRDYIIEISNGSYVVGERVHQAAANQTYYTIEVDDGIWANLTTVIFNANNDVDATANVIYIPSAVLDINRTLHVRGNTDFIEVSNDLANGEAVRYYTDTGNTGIGTNNTIGVIQMANSSGFIITGFNVSDVGLEAFNPDAIVNNFISIPATALANDDIVRYVADTGNTALSALANNSQYYVVEANSTGIRLSNELAGDPITIEAGANEAGHAVILFNENANGHHFAVLRNELANGQAIRYTAVTGNTAVGGLSNNTIYYVVGANTSSIKLASTYNGSALDITAGPTELGHIIQPLFGWQPYDYVIGPAGNAEIVAVLTDSSSLYVRGLNGTIDPGDALTSNTFSYINANTVAVDSEQVTIQAKGIIKSANTTHVLVKRIQFENTFTVGDPLTGEISGANGDIISIAEDQTVNQIGLNANVEANVITADGQVTDLDIIDSGYGYSNSEIVQFTSADGLRSGSAKVVIGGSGVGRGYYRSSKGFLSDVFALHDGDYYQEYSYEVFSKLSVDRYADMFKKVMHTAGTKFFGSARVVEEAAVVVSVDDSSVEQEES